MTLGELRRAIRESLEEESGVDGEEESSSQPIASDEEGFLVPEGVQLGQLVESPFGKKELKEKNGIIKKITEKDLPKLKSALEKFSVAAGKGKIRSLVISSSLIETLRVYGAGNMQFMMAAPSLKIALSKLAPVSASSVEFGKKWNAAFSPNANALFQKFEGIVIKLIQNKKSDLYDLRDVHGDLMFIANFFTRATNIAIKSRKILTGGGKSKKATPLAPPKSVFGRIAFAPERAPSARSPLMEPDTAKETQVFKVLVKHIDDNIPMPKSACTTLMTILKSGKYSDIIKAPPEDAVIYRGMQVREKFLKQIFKASGKSASSKQAKGNNTAASGTIKKNFTFVPRKGGSSAWTNKRTIADKFKKNPLSNKFLGNNAFNIILKARVSDNPNKFLMGPGGIYHLARVANFKTEYEVMALDKIKVFEIEYERSYGSSLSASQKTYSWSPYD